MCMNFAHNLFYKLSIETINLITFTQQLQINHKSILNEKIIFTLFTLRYNNSLRTKYCSHTI